MIEQYVRLTCGWEGCDETCHIWVEMEIDKNHGYYDYYKLRKPTLIENMPDNWAVDFGIYCPQHA